VGVAAISANVSQMRQPDGQVFDIQRVLRLLASPAAVTDDLVAFLDRITSPHYAAAMLRALADEQYRMPDEREAAVHKAFKIADKKYDHFMSSKFYLERMGLDTDALAKGEMRFL
jgi:hypothetical protein